METAVFQPKFIKPFSRGQVTLPKNYRDYLGIDENSWLKVCLWNNQILIKPVKEVESQKAIKPKIGLKAYRKILFKIKGGWFDEREHKKMRNEIEKRLLENEKALA